MLQEKPWQGTASIRFYRSGGRTIHQGGCTATLKLSRPMGLESTCELLFTAHRRGLGGGRLPAHQLPIGIPEPWPAHQRGSPEGLWYLS